MKFAAAGMLLRLMHTKTRRILRK